MPFLTQLDNGLAWYCPACKTYHGGDSRWSFDGNEEAPTFTPSFLVRYTKDGIELARCHTFIRNGNIEYLDDCSHSYRGKTIPMVDAEDDKAG